MFIKNEDPEQQTPAAGSSLPPVKTRNAQIASSAPILSKEEIQDIEHKLDSATKTAEAGRELASNVSKRGQGIKRAAQKLNRPIADIDENIKKLKADIAKQEEKLKEDVKKKKNPELLKIQRRSLQSKKDHLAQQESMKKNAQNFQSGVQRAGQNLQKAGKQVDRMTTALERKVTQNTERLDAIRGGIPPSDSPSRPRTTSNTRQ